VFGDLRGVRRGTDLTSPARPAVSSATWPRNGPSPSHYSFHIMDPEWGHLTITMSGHPPFGAQVILNGHEYVATQAYAAGIGFAKERQLFHPHRRPPRPGWRSQTPCRSLTQVCQRWISTACLCFGLDLDEQERSCFRYSYSVFQAQYTPHPAVHRRRPDGPSLRPDGRPDPLPAGACRCWATLFGAKQRPGRNPHPRPVTSARSHDRDTSV
jgi:hypothetical protein